MRRGLLPGHRPVAQEGNGTQGTTCCSLSSTVIYRRTFDPTLEDPGKRRPMACAMMSRSGRPGRLTHRKIGQHWGRSEATTPSSIPALVDCLQSVIARKRHHHQVLECRGRLQIQASTTGESLIGTGDITCSLLRTIITTMPTCVGTLNVLAPSFGSKSARQRSQHEVTMLAHRRSIELYISSFKYGDSL